MQTSEMQTSEMQTSEMQTSEIQTSEIQTSEIETQNRESRHAGDATGNALPGLLRATTASPTPVQAHRRINDDELDLTIVVPCFNEERNIAATLHTIAAAMQELPWSYEVLVIDDGSSDQTVAVAESFIQQHLDLPVRLHKNPRNRGLTRTYVDGAFLGRGKYYRMVCGDSTEPKETLLKIFGTLGGADIVLPYHETVPGKPAFRRKLSQLYTGMVNALSGYHLHYYNGSAVHYRYNVMRWGPYSFGFGFQAELITRLLDEGATVVEIPVVATHVEKGGPNSALNFRNYLSVGHTLLEVLIRRVRREAFKR